MLFFKKILFLERGEEREEKEGEKHPSPLPLTHPQPGTWPPT